MSYLAQDAEGQEVFLTLLSDWDLDAAFQCAADPCLRLKVDLNTFGLGHYIEISVLALPWLLVFFPIICSIAVKQYLLLYGDWAISEFVTMALAQHWYGVWAISELVAMALAQHWYGDWAISELVAMALAQHWYGDSAILELVAMALAQHWYGDWAISVLVAMALAQHWYGD